MDNNGCLEEVFRVPIYKEKLIIVVTDDLPTFCEEREMGQKSRFVNYDALVCNHPTDGIYVVFDKDILSTSMVVHELVHIINEIYINCGIKLSRTNDEHQAYLTQFIYEEVCKILNLKI